VLLVPPPEVVAIQITRVGGRAGWTGPARHPFSVRPL
jgi:hypothetical protein